MSRITTRTWEVHSSAASEKFLTCKTSLVLRLPQGKRAGLKVNTDPSIRSRLIQSLIAINKFCYV